MDASEICAMFNLDSDMLQIVRRTSTGIDGMAVTVRKGFCSKVQSRQTYIGRSCRFIVRTASLPAVEIAHGLSKFEPRAFRRIANDQLPANPLMILMERREGDIFKVRNPIRNCSDKLLDFHYRAFSISIDFEFKDSEMNQAGE
jgi:hypothetical protein